MALIQRRSGRALRSRGARGGTRAAQALLVTRGIRALARRRRRRPGRMIGAAGLAALAAGAIATLLRRRRGGGDVPHTPDTPLEAQPTGGDERTARDVGGPTSPTSQAGESVSETATGEGTGTRTAQPRFEPHS